MHGRLCKVVKDHQPYKGMLQPGPRQCRSVGWWVLVLSGKSTADVAVNSVDWGYNLLGLWWSQSVAILEQSRNSSAVLRVVDAVVILFVACSMVKRGGSCSRQLQKSQVHCCRETLACKSERKTVSMWAAWVSGYRKVLVVIFVVRAAKFWQLQECSLLL